MAQQSYPRDGYSSQMNGQRTSTDVLRPLHRSPAQRTCVPYPLFVCIRHSYQCNPPGSIQDHANAKSCTAPRRSLSLPAPAQARSVDLHLEESDRRSYRQQAREGLSPADQQAAHSVTAPITRGPCSPPPTVPDPRETSTQDHSLTGLP